MITFLKMDLLAILMKQREGGVLTSVEEDLIATIDATMNKVNKEKQVSELEDRINSCKLEIIALSEQHANKKAELSDLTKQLDDLKPKSSKATKQSSKATNSVQPWLKVAKTGIIPDAKVDNTTTNKDENINWFKICKKSGFEPGIYKITADSYDETIEFNLEFTRLNSIVELPEGFPFVDRNTIQFADPDMQIKDFYPILGFGGIKLILSEQFINANR